MAMLENTYAETSEIMENEDGIRYISQKLREINPKKFIFFPLSYPTEIHHLMKRQTILSDGTPVCYPRAAPKNINFVLTTSCKSYCHHCCTSNNVDKAVQCSWLNACGCCETRRNFCIIIRN